MGILVWLIVGGVVGWLASIIMRTDAQQGILLNVIVGIVGALLAGFIVSPMVGVGTINEGVTLATFLVSLLGEHDHGHRVWHRMLLCSFGANHAPRCLGRPACRDSLRAATGLRVRHQLARARRRRFPPGASPLVPDAAAPGGGKQW